MLEYKEGKTDHWWPDNAISAWEELQALVVKEVVRVKPDRDAGTVVLLLLVHVEPCLKLAFGKLVCRVKLLTLSIDWSSALSLP
ncbi:hypothetical protein ACOSP7_010135 [Xanthoceras sorbifolium]